MDKRKIVRYLLITLSVILGVLVFLSITGTVAHAAGLVDNTVSDANTYSKYPLENYQLDFYVDSSWDWLPWNWLDGIGKSIQYGLYAITNFVWTVSLYISNATGYVVQEAYKLDFISDTASSIGKNIQTLAGVTSSGFSSEGFYVGFLLILILVMGIYVAYTGLIKRETLTPCNFIIMDEPTNHLDIQAKQALRIALKEFKGTVLLVSHEPAFYKEIAQKIINIENIIKKK